MKKKLLKKNLFHTTYLITVPLPHLLSIPPHLTTQLHALLEKTKKKDTHQKNVPQKT